MTDDSRLHAPAAPGAAELAGGVQEKKPAKVVSKTMLSATRHNMTAAEYFALPAISRSDLELARESLKVYQGRKDGTLPGPSETRALRIGRLFHLAALEPALFERTVTVAPTTDDDFTGTGAKARREAWKALLESWHEALPSGMIVADPAELLTVTSIVHSLRTTQTGAASVARRLLFGRSGESEVTVTWTDSGPDLAAPMACRARLDRLIERAGTAVSVVDLKSTDDPSPEEFARSVARYGYHRQAAWYSTAAEALTGVRPSFAFVAVRSSPPYEVSVYELEPEAVEQGERENRETLAELSRAMATGNYAASWESGVTTINLPKWARSK